MDKHRLKYEISMIINKALSGENFRYNQPNSVYTDWDLVKEDIDKLIDRYPNKPLNADTKKKCDKFDGHFTTRICKNCGRYSYDHFCAG